MDKYIYLAAWVSMTGAAMCAIAAKADWTTTSGRILGAGTVLSALGAALMHPPAQAASVSPAPPQGTPPAANPPPGNTGP